MVAEHQDSCAIKYVLSMTEHLVILFLLISVVRDLQIKK